ncbi:Hypothetical_protein [Hexamita inflata]|uniref:Hypothetical_protein n=1 Tax=Hexamita inflata TaxID=28002 RepID=A0AA86Q734_9EUKA|nr:Hypothetical protein HINF_LOCUS34957 [Hexamita inflata]
MKTHNPRIIWDHDQIISEGNINRSRVTFYLFKLNHERQFFLKAPCDPSKPLMLLVGSSGSAKCSEWLTDLCTKVDDRCLYTRLAPTKNRNGGVGSFRKYFTMYQ